MSVEFRCARNASPAAPCQTPELSFRKLFIRSFACSIEDEAREIFCCITETLAVEPGAGSNPRFGYAVVAPNVVSSP
ncbi:hypothetical protein Ahu01nite_082590 [Winogradskya humida]|uniref:Uncharacterized protein n=1 Tax=Winogradskya humida TaxID=113566 RepID=A0ABQ4A2T6_9ACTN|nr:hypothetical protein Ahu01nite_082590 [Actinoplanes humidus]